MPRLRNRIAARVLRCASACTDGGGHATSHGDQRARTARAGQLAGLRALQAPGGLRLLLGFDGFPPWCDGDRTERREVGPEQAAVDDFALMLR